MVRRNCLAGATLFLMMCQPVKAWNTACRPAQPGGDDRDGEHISEVSEHTLHSSTLEGCRALCQNSSSRCFGIEYTGPSRCKLWLVPVEVSQENVSQGSSTCEPRAGSGLKMMMMTVPQLQHYLQVLSSMFPENESTIAEHGMSVVTGILNGSLAMRMEALLNNGSIKPTEAAQSAAEPGNLPKLRGSPYPVRLVTACQGAVVKLLFDTFSMVFSFVGVHLEWEAFNNRELLKELPFFAEAGGSMTAWARSGLQASMKAIGEASGAKNKAWALVAFCRNMWNAGLFRSALQAALAGMSPLDWVLSGVTFVAQLGAWFTTGGWALFSEVMLAATLVAQVVQDGVEVASACVERSRRDVEESISFLTVVTSMNDGHVYCSAYCSGNWNTELSGLGWQGACCRSAIHDGAEVSCTQRFDDPVFCVCQADDERPFRSAGGPLDKSGVCEDAQADAALDLLNNWVPAGDAWNGVYGTPTINLGLGVCLVDGLIRGGSWGHLATLPAECRPSKRLIFNMNNHEATARVDVFANGEIHWVAGGQQHGWISLSGIAFSLVGGGGQQAVPLANGWVTYGGEYGIPSYDVSAGVCFVDGLIKGGSWGHLATLPEECRPNKRLIFNMNNHEATARVDVFANGEIHGVAGGQQHGWISLSGIAFSLGKGGQREVPLANGWVTYGGVYGTPSYDVSEGLCFVDGLIKGGSWGHLATLPADCRPSKQLIFNMNNHEATARVDVFANGEIHWVAGGQQHGWISLSGIVFDRVPLLPLANGWVAYGGVYGTPTYDASGDVCSVDVLIRGGSWGHLATLPADCRPSKRLIFNMNNHEATARVDVFANGEIHWVAGGQQHGWISLSGIAFSLVGGGGQQAVPLANGWVTYGGEYGIPSYDVSAGVCFVDGLIKGGSWGHLATLPEECRPNKRLIFNMNNHEATARVDVFANGEIHGVAGGQQHGWISLSGIAFSLGKGGQREVPLANGWVTYGGVYGTPSYDVSEGLCFVDGLIKGGSWGHLATLPADCRPSKRLIFNMNNHEATARVDVTEKGEILWMAGGQQHGWISLSGIVFTAVLS